MMFLIKHEWRSDALNYCVNHKEVPFKLYIRIGYAHEHNWFGHAWYQVGYLAQRVTNDVYSTTKNVNVLVRTFFI